MFFNLYFHSINIHIYFIFLFVELIHGHSCYKIFCYFRGENKSCFLFFLVIPYNRK